jgi:hypothetical protein
MLKTFALPTFLLPILMASCARPTHQHMIEIKNGEFKVEIQYQELNNSGIQNIDICVMNINDRKFPKQGIQCPLHGFDLSDISVKWLSARSFEISFNCGRVTKFTNYSIVSKGQYLPVEFHATLKDACNAASEAGGNAAEKS